MTCPVACSPLTGSYGAYGIGFRHAPRWNALPPPPPPHLLSLSPVLVLLDPTKVTSRQAEWCHCRYRNGFMFGEEIKLEFTALCTIKSI